MWVLFLRSFRGNEAHQLSVWAQNGGLWGGGGGQKVYVEKVYVLLPSLENTPPVLEGVPCFDNPAPAVYKILGS